MLLLLLLLMLLLRYAIMSIKNEKSGGGAKTKDLYDLFGRSAVFLGATNNTELQFRNYISRVRRGAIRLVQGSLAVV